MRINTINIPDFVLNDDYRRRRKAKFELVHKFQHPEIVLSNRHQEVNTEVSLLPHMEVSKILETPGILSTEPYHNNFHVNRLQENNNYFWNQTSGLQLPSKDFPDFKSALEQTSKSYNVLDSGCSSLQLTIDGPKKDETFQEENKSLDHYYRKQACDDYVIDKIPKAPNSVKTSKKVKWEDGYCDTPSREWYPKRDKYRMYYKNYAPYETRPSYSYGNFLNYNKKYPDYDYDNYDVKYDDNGTMTSYSSSRNVYPNDYNRCYDLYPYHYPKSAKYGRYNNWLYLQKDSEYFNPYHNHYDKSTPKKYGSLTPKSYKNSDTQYDLSEKVHNKKLQVCQSDSSKISDKKVQVESKKVGRLTKSEESLNKLEDAGTQITESIHKSHQTLPSRTEMKLKTDLQKPEDTAVISKLLQEITEKLKTSEDSLSSSKQKCFLIERGTQYFRRDETKKSRIKKSSAPKRQPKILESKRHSRSRWSHVIIMQNESTQYEDIKSSENFNFTTSTLNTEFEFEKQLFLKDQPKNTFCEVESIKKRKQQKSGTYEERIHAKRFVKDMHPKGTKRNPQVIDNSHISSKSFKFVNTEQRVPFVTENKCRNYDCPSDYRASFEGRLLEYKKISDKSDDYQEKKRSSSLDTVRGKSRRTTKHNHETRSLSVSSTKSDLSNPEDRYLERYVIKLSNPDEELILYDVKPKFCDYLSNKGVKKTIVQKLKSGTESRDIV